jgi:hypothetical protein
MAKTQVRPFVKPGEQLGFVAPLKERGLWPPPLRDPNDPTHDHRKTATPFLVIPVSVTPPDSGARPQPNSKSFHSKGIWIEDAGGAMVTAPVVGGQYRIKCRLRNLGAFPAYGGMADFFINTPAAFTAAAGTATTLPSLGHTGFSLLMGQDTVIACPNLWQPATPADLASSIVVHAYDPFADNLVSRFDARNDRHVGRHDFTPDLYVRDWTDSAAVHDDGVEPSTQNVFYRTSDVWNRRSAAAGAFVGDAPQNQDPQAGNGTAGDNFMFARISRNDASVEQTVRAHFLFAEFGTGSPYIDCSTAADPSVTLAPGVSSQIVSLPWHLHPSSSNHLCIAVQVYSDGDPYLPPGLLGYTPGWPTTDLMVINDNNKAQRNIAVWDGVPDTEGIHFGIVFNAATFVRDVTLSVGASKGALEKFTNPRLSIPASGITQEFKPGGTLVLKQMLPGERRWLAFSYDRAALADAGSVSVFFNEVVGKSLVNGFGFDLRPTSATRMVQAAIAFQAAVFSRMADGMGVGAAKEGVVLCQRLQETKPTAKTYAQALPAIAGIMTQSLAEMSAKFGGIRDSLGVTEDLTRLAGLADADPARTLALHRRVLQKTDALQTMAVKSKGDVADILFTVRLQRDVYRKEPLVSSDRFKELLSQTEAFIKAYPVKRGAVKTYVPFVQSLAPAFEATAGLLGAGPVRTRQAELLKSLARPPQEVQRAHLSFLNAVLVTLMRR